MVNMSNENIVSDMAGSQPEPERRQRIFRFKPSQWIWFLLYVVEVLIVLRVGLKLMGANPDSPIVAWIYGITSLLLIPFVGLTGSLTNGAMILETSSIYAIGIYAFAAVAIERLIWLIFYRPRVSSVRVTDTTTNGNHTTP